MENARLEMKSPVHSDLKSFITNTKPQRKYFNIMHRAAAQFYVDWPPINVDQ